MLSQSQVRSLAALLFTAAAVVGCTTASGAAPAASDNKPVMLAQGGEHRTSPFKGIKANTGYAIHTTANGKQVLKVSDDFVIPDTPAPHWQVVDSLGNTYLLKQFKIKDGKFNRQIVLPAYIRDVAKVQVWCSFAETLLGEASFESPVN